VEFAYQLLEQGQITAADIYDLFFFAVNLEVVNHYLHLRRRCSRRIEPARDHPAYVVGPIVCLKPYQWHHFNRTLNFRAMRVNCGNTLIVAEFSSLRSSSLRALNQLGNQESYEAFCSYWRNKVTLRPAERNALK
jgi:hypothetical protein